MSVKHRTHDPGRIYASVFDVLEQIENDRPPNPFPVGDDEGYEWIDFGDEDGGRIMPSLNSRFVSPFLYRGQIKHYSPCLPSLYRRLPATRDPSTITEDQRAGVLLNIIRQAEFQIVLPGHPAIQLASEIGLHLNRIALAQHYGIATDHLDLTQDPEVAAFFAVCQPRPDGTWIPVNDGIGIIYSFDLTAFPRALGDHAVPGLFKFTELIGLQTLPRPGEQKAWTMCLPPVTDFEELPLTRYQFSHSATTSERVLARFQGGDKLFPDDVLADLAQQIRDANSLSRIMVERVLLDQGCAPNLLSQALIHYKALFERAFNVTLSDRDPIRLSGEQLGVAKAKCDSMRITFLNKVGVRGVKIRDVDQLVAILESNDRRPWAHLNRAAAAANLGELGGSAARALPQLRKALSDESPIVRQKASDAIARIEARIEAGLPTPPSVRDTRNESGA